MDVREARRGDVGKQDAKGRQASIMTCTLLAGAVCLVSALDGLTVSPARADDLANHVPSESALRTKMALKLAGLVTFVAGSCPEIAVDYPRFKRTLAGLGASYEDLSKTDMKALYLGYAMRYKSDLKGNCSRALTDFGPDGRVVPHLFTVIKGP